MRARLVAGLMLLLCPACGGYPAAGSYVLDTEATLGGPIPEQFRAAVQIMNTQLLLEAGGAYRVQSQTLAGLISSQGTYEQSGASLSFVQTHENGQPKPGVLNGTYVDGTLRIMLNTGAMQIPIVLRRAGS